MKEGRYRLEGNMFVIEGKKYVIRERKEEKRSNPKPKRFLIQCSPFQYISSLFPIPSIPGAYNFDFERELYQLKVGEVEVELLKIEPV
mgnify:FL=1|jgi:hypothetical protein